MEKIASMFASKVRSFRCPSSNPATATHFACWLKTQKRPSESKDEVMERIKKDLKVDMALRRTDWRVFAFYLLVLLVAVCADGAGIEAGEHRGNK